jgi:transposase
MYAEPFRDMGEESWIEANVNALEYYGGVPALFVPDNTKTAVNKVRKHESVLNRSYEDMARYYGGAIVPTRAYSPRDKAPVETAVQIAERRIIARLRNRQFLSFAELQGAVKEELERVNNAPFQKMPESRAQVFREVEKAALKPLPPARYEYAQFKSAKVNFDYHVLFDSFYYSVPWLYAGKYAEVRATSRVIEVFVDHERVAIHERNYDKRKRYSTKVEHMPPAHQAMAEWTPERFLSWASKTGVNMKTYIEWMMEQRDAPQQAFKTCAAVLRLAGSCQKETVEAAASKAIVLKVYGYTGFERLLKKQTTETAQPLSHGNIRGAEYYQEVINEL